MGDVIKANRDFISPPIFWAIFHFPLENETRKMLRRIEKSAAVDDLMG